CRGRAHTPEVGEPGGTAEFPSTGAYAPQTLGLLSISDLPHLDADLEGLGHILDQLPEIHPVLGRIIEGCLGSIPLELHIAEFHFELQCDGDFPGMLLDLLLPIPTFLPDIDIPLAG